MTRRIRANKLSRRLSTTTPTRRPDDDANDLIKVPSATTSLARADSRTSTTTCVRHDPTTILPTDSSTQHKWLTASDLNLQTLFDNAETLDALTGSPDYPIVRMETVQSPSHMPPETSPAGAEMGEGTSRASERLRSHLQEPEGNGNRARKGQEAEAESGSRSRLKRSMTGLLKRGSKRFPRSSFSLKSLGALTTPTAKGRDTPSSVDEEGGHGMAEQKWLEANGLTRVTSGVPIWGLQ